MFHEPRARATRRRPAMAKSDEAGAERAHLYSILAASCDDDDDCSRRRHLGDYLPFERTQKPVKSLIKSHDNKFTRGRSRARS